MNNGPVIVVDDDDDDREFLRDAWSNLQLGNELVFINNAEDVLEYLTSSEKGPFIILCDVNLPKMNGFELKEKIFEDKVTNYKSIPFVFWSNTVSEAQIKKAYDLGGNGFFLKGNTFQEIEQSLIEIVNYWSKCKVPQV